MYTIDTIIKLVDVFIRLSKHEEKEYLYRHYLLAIPTFSFYKQ